MLPVLLGHSGAERVEVGLVMQWYALCPAEFCRNVVKRPSTGLGQTEQGVSECYDGHRHKEQVHIRSTEFLSREREEHTHDYILIKVAKSHTWE